MAEYVRAEMNKVDWDKSRLQEILDNYPKYYTWLLFFYQYISKHRVWNQQTKNKKVYDGWEITIPKEYLEKKTHLEKIGVYKNIEDALFERDFLVANDWNYDLLVETIDDKDNPYYDMDLPTYPTRKIRNISKRNYRETELTAMMELIKEGPSLSQKEIADKLGIVDVTIRNWLKRLYNTDYSEFKRLVLDGVNPLEVLERNEQLKSDLKYWSQTAEARLKEIDKLRKDNEELKQYNKDLKEGLKDAEKRIEVQKWQLQVYREKEADLKQRLFEAKRDYLMETSDISDALYIDEEMEQLRKEVYDI